MSPATLVPQRPRIELAAMSCVGRTRRPAISLDLAGLVLAGGRGTRLSPLTRGRAKAAVPFGGGFRLIDFVLSNFVNSGLHKIGVVTQFGNAPLLEHLSSDWTSRGPWSVRALPDRVHCGDLWFSGTADAVYRNRAFLNEGQHTDVAVFGADHVYRMDLRPMFELHRRKGAEATVSALPVPLEEARRFGVMEIDSDWRVVGFHEKAAYPPQIPGSPGWSLASMGNYIFDKRSLLAELRLDAANPASSHDFGHDILPRMVSAGNVYAHDFLSSAVPGENPHCSGYWRDVGTIPAYYQANLDALPRSPRVDLLNSDWPMAEQASPVGASGSSLLSAGCDIEGASVVDSVLGPGVQVSPGADVRDSILMAGSRVGANAKIRRAILAEGLELPAGCQFGADDDRTLYYLDHAGPQAVGQAKPAARLALAS